MHHAKPAQAVVAHRRVGMDHVVGARERRDGDAGRIRRGARCRPAASSGIASGIGGRPTQAMLNWVHVIARRRAPPRARLAASVPGKVLAKMPDLHQTAPVHGGDLARACPAAADRAIAAMARTEARPSSMSAPRIGAPSSTVSAKPSSWRRKKCPSAPSGLARRRVLLVEDLDLARAEVPGVEGLREDEPFSP